MITLRLEIGTAGKGSRDELIYCKSEWVKSNASENEERLAKMLNLAMKEMELLLSSRYQTQPCMMIEGQDIAAATKAAFDREIKALD